MSDINYTYVNEELKEHMQHMVDEHFTNTYQSLKLQFDTWLKAEDTNEWLEYNSKIKVGKMANSDYRTIKALEVKLNSVKNQFEKYSDEIGHNAHTAHKMEIPQAKYEQLLRLKNNYEVSLNLVKSSFKAISKYYKEMFDEDFIPTSVQQTRKAVSSQMNQVKSFNRNQFSLFSLKA